MEFDFSRYQPVNPDRYRSIAYPDNGKHFFIAARRICQIGATPGNVACSGHSATAPRGVRGVAITGDMQGPQWIPPGTTYRFGSRAGFRAPVLKTGTRVSVGNTTCAVPRRGVVACSTPNRAFALNRAWHRFYYPRGDTSHSRNPKSRYLPAHLR
ncbi:hypothetical protein [Gordonia zhaorongruii]|uniref:hypothetical protein n=1 Tax=Gordonia zhaorongruii TaxID=2597659 RepID=UPI001F1F1946|nr:hypothetical protein [Gordonia zhaorongruii]